MRLSISSLLILGLLAPGTHAFTAAQSTTLNMLRQEAARDAALGAAGSLKATKANAGASFDGSKEVPFHIKTLKPVEFLDAPRISSGKEIALKKPQQDKLDEIGREKAATDSGEKVVVPEESDKTPLPAAGKNPTYGFKGKRIPNLGVVTYTPYLLAPGEDGTVETPEKGSDWRSWAPKAMLVGGIAATIGGFFFPPLLFLGGALLGAWGMLKLISAKTGGD